MSGQIQEQRALKGEQIPYTRLETDPLKVADFQDIVDYANDFQERYGVPSTEISPDMVHLLDDSGMEQLSALYDNVEGAIYDDTSGIIFMRNMNIEQPVARLCFNHILTHEMGHHITPGLLRLSHDALSEASAEKFARERTRAWRAEHAPEQEQLLRAHAGDFDKAWFTTDGKIWNFSYIHETKFLEEVEDRLGPHGTNLYWQQAMTAGQGTAGNDFVDRALGRRELQSIRQSAFYPKSS